MLPEYSIDKYNDDIFICFKMDFFCFKSRQQKSVLTGAAKPISTGGLPPNLVVTGKMDFSCSMVFSVQWF